MDDDMPEETGDRNEYNVTILKQIQAIFGHLAETQLQYYVPKGLWKHFRMSGEPGRYIFYIYSYIRVVTHLVVIEACSHLKHTYPLVSNYTSS